MRGKREDIIIKIDETYDLLVDRYNWCIIDKKAKDGINNTYHPNLARAIEKIMSHKTREGEDVRDLRTYMAWYQTTINEVANRVLSQKKLLQKALELNGVM